MTIRSKTQYLEYIEAILPDNSSRLISPADIRVAFRDLADSVGEMLEETEIVATNFSTPDTRTTRGGDLSLTQIGLDGRVSIDNTAYGYQTLSINYNGSRNTAIGSRVLACNSFGDDNVGVGYNALGSNTIGSGNVSLGNYALVKNPKGNHNIAIGHGAGYYISDNSSQKFYLGVYPDASGDCETGIDPTGAPPLLYGDLKTRQLGVGTDIFVSGGVGLAVSGDVIPASGQSFSLGHEDYRWNAYFNNVYVGGEIDVPLAWSFAVSDQEGASGVTYKEDIIFMSGVSGISTTYYPDFADNSGLMILSAQPVSGWANSNFESVTGSIIEISGKGGQLLTVSGIVDNVSGWADHTIKDYAYRSGVQVSGWAENTILHYAEVSGYQVSGWANNNLYQISGFNGLLNDLSGIQNGLIYLASGWNKKYTEDYVDAQIVDAGSYTFWEIEGQFGGSGQIHHADTLVVSGISGIETRMDIDEGAGGTTFYNLSVSAHPISGWASGTFTEISGVDGIIDQRVTASAVYLSGLAYDFAVDKASDASAYATAISGWTDFQIDKYAYISGYQVSGWAADNLEILSGVKPSIYGPSGLIWTISGSTREYVDTQINGAINQAGSYTFWEAEDQYGDYAQLHHADVLSISGCSGIITQFSINETSDSYGSPDQNFYRLDVSAAPISGYMESRLTDISGVILGLSGVNGTISGAIYHAIETEVGTIAGGLDSALKTSINTDFIIPLQEDLFELGFESGYKVSGWADTSFHAISGNGGLLHSLSGYPNGLIYQVSGWNAEYTRKQIANITFPDGQDQYVNWFAEADAGNAQAVGASRYVKFRGINGLNSLISNDGTKTYVDISAQGLVDDLLEITGVNGIIDQKIDDAGGDGTLYIWSAGDDFGNTSPIGGSDVLKFVGEDGIVATVSTDDKVTISAGSLRTDIDNLRNKIDCIVDVNCGEKNVENVSGWVLSNLTTLSGIDPTIYGRSGLIWSISGQLTEAIQNKIVDAGAYDSWTIRDADGPNLDVNTGDVITFASPDALTVTRDGNTINISADPLSGVVIADLLAISGVGGIIDTRITNSLSDADIGLLGQAKTYTNNQILALTGVNGWVDEKLDPISGVNGTITGVYDYAYAVSGHAQAISGWADYSFHQISGIDGKIPSLSGWADFTMDKYAYESGVLVSGYTYGVSGWADFTFTSITGVGGLIDSIDQNLYYGDSGIKLINGDTFVTHGSGYFDKVILSRRDDASDPSGQIVSDTGVSSAAYNDIVNASGYLITPKYNKLTTLKSSLPASPANSGAIVFANEHPYQSHGDRWSRPTVIEGFMRDQLLPPTAYGAPTSGRMYVRNDNFASDYEVYVTNRDFYLGISGDLMCVAMLVNGEYRPIYASPSGCEV